MSQNIQEIGVVRRNITLLPPFHSDPLLFLSVSERFESPYFQEKGAREHIYTPAKSLYCTQPIHSRLNF